ncbi:hypothetical protein JXA32_14665 [Candidatus Sumerlaeota bacterium]|nr:hypothetical protein [Candidatus Sumerlaeota bacterium]
MSRKYLTVTGVMVLLLAAVAYLPAQDTGGRQRGGPEGGGPGGGGRGGDFRARMMERQKEELNVTDEEWQVIEPLLTKVSEKQQSLRMAQFRGMMGRRGGQGGGPWDDQEMPAAVTELQTLLEQENPSADEIKAKLAAYREWRTQLEDDLNAAREELKKVLTLKQEAQMVMMGVLE